MRLTRLIFFVALVACAFLAQNAIAAPEILNFSNVSGGAINFVGTGAGASFTFPPSGTDFVITDSQNFTSPGSLVNLVGEITGTFSYFLGSVVTNGSTETALVTGSGGQFIIHDGSSVDFTGDVVWNDISTFPSGGGLNGLATVNLLNFHYTGANALLSELANKSSGSIVASFTFNPTMDLKTLASTACALPGCSAPFSGTLTASTRGDTSTVPEPQFYGIMLAGLLGLAAFVRSRLTA